MSDQTKHGMGICLGNMQTIPILLYTFAAHWLQYAQFSVCTWSSPLLLAVKIWGVASK